jgi:ribosomal protein L37E
MKPAQQEPIRLSRPSDADPGNLPERVADLERRVNDLEQRLGGRPAGIQRVTFGDGVAEFQQRPTPMPMACRTCGHSPEEHHKLRCEAEGCEHCNGWRCPAHDIVLCGCTYDGGPSPSSQRTDAMTSTVHQCEAWQVREGRCAACGASTIDAPARAGSI